MRHRTHYSVCTRLSLKELAIDEKKKLPQIKKTNIVEPRFEVSDFFLVSRAVDRSHKLQRKWLEQLRIEKVHSPLIFSTEKRNGTASEHVHTTCVTRYSPKLEGAVVPIEISELADHTNAKTRKIGSFIDISEYAHHTIMI